MRFVTFVHFLLVCVLNHIWAESENFLYSLVKLLLMSIKAKFALHWDLVFSRMVLSRSEFEQESKFSVKIYSVRETLSIGPEL